MELPLGASDAVTNCFTVMTKESSLTLWDESSVLSGPDAAPIINDKETENVNAPLFFSLRHCSKFCHKIQEFLR